MVSGDGVERAAEVFARLVRKLRRRGRSVRWKVNGRRGVVELRDVERLSDEVRREQLILLCSGGWLLCLWSSLTLLGSQVHLIELLIEGIRVLGRGLPICWRRLSVCRRWCPVCRRWCPIAWRCSPVGGRWCSIACWCWGSSSLTLTASIGSKLIRRARISVPLLAVRHVEYSAGCWGGERGNSHEHSGDGGTASEFGG